MSAIRTRQATALNTDSDSTRFEGVEWARQLSGANMTRAIDGRRALVVWIRPRLDNFPRARLERRIQRPIKCMDGSDSAASATRQVDQITRTESRIIRA